MDILVYLHTHTHTLKTTKFDTQLVDILVYTHTPLKQPSLIPSMVKDG